MNIIWDDVRKKCNISDPSFIDMINNYAISSNELSGEDKEFILTSYNAKMYNYVVEYVYNKAVKILQDTIFSMGEEVVVNVTHWIDRTVVSNFFDVFVLRLAHDLGLISKDDKILFLNIIEFLQHKKESFVVEVEDFIKEKAKYFICSLFEAVLSKDYSVFVQNINDSIQTLLSVNILPDSEEYHNLINKFDLRKNVLIRLLISLVKSESIVDKKELKILVQNIKNLFSTLWEKASLNEKKFFCYYLKSSSPDSELVKIFSELSDEIKLQEFSTDLTTITKILKNCQDILSYHYSVSSHKEETAPLIKLNEIEVYPKFFLRSVITPSVITYLGNNNGYIRESREIAGQILDKISTEKWKFYFKNFFESDDFVLINLFDVKDCLKDWCSLIKKSGVNEDDFQEKEIREIISASRQFDIEKVKILASNLYYKT